ncbi:hypothetical protein RYH73_02205 [Olivibacter sp. CPCC 100613]|uniref:hypothetical protein n=1 Tax=Olivibacter sp. CPCC 100613 TaxID=3079931 RepID=UPI002FF65C9B
MNIQYCISKGNTNQISFLFILNTFHKNIIVTGFFAAYNGEEALCNSTGHYMNTYQ